MSSKVNFTFIFWLFFTCTNFSFAGQPRSVFVLTFLFGDRFLYYWQKLTCHRCQLKQSSRISSARKTLANVFVLILLEYFDANAFARMFSMSCISVQQFIWSVQDSRYDAEFKVEQMFAEKFQRMNRRAVLMEMYFSIEDPVHRGLWIMQARHVLWTALSSRRHRWVYRLLLSIRS